MGLFDEQVAELEAYISEALAEGIARVLEPVSGAWPEGPSIVLEEDMALELGNPSGGSLSVLVWTDAPVADGRVTLVGPDILEASSSSMPLGQVLIVSARFDNEYDSFRDIRDAVYDSSLEGFSVRAMPSRQTLWCRVSKGAAASGLSFAHIGSTYIEALKSVEGVMGAEALFVTAGPEDIGRLKPAAAGAHRLVEAMMKMYQENNFDCETCEYADVCDTVMDLKMIRTRLEAEQSEKR